MSWPRYWLLLVAGFLGSNALFALGYIVCPGSIANVRPGSFEDAFYFSVQTMVTIGYGGMAPATRLGHLLVTAEAFASMVGLAVVTGVTFAKFSRPTARVLFCERAVVGPRDGVLHLMFRMANWRHNQIVEARARVVLMRDTRTREGEPMRRAVDLPLVRDRTAMFALSWTAMHCIDEQSPFHGAQALEVLRGQNAEIFVSLAGIDATTGQTVHAYYYYTLDDIVWGARFADVLRTQPDGTRVIDYRRFHDTVGVDGGA